MKKYKALLFDADETLLDFTRSEAQAFRLTAEHCGVEYSDDLLAMYSTSNKECWLMLERGEITKVQLMTRRFERFFERAGLSCDANQWNNFYKKQLENTGFLLPFTIEVLEYAKQFYDLYIITNGIASVQYSRLKNAGIDRYFSNIFISEELGSEKPSTAYFDAVFKNLEYQPEQTLVIGDSLTSDIAGGIGYGIDTVFINRKNVSLNLAPTYVVKDLPELLQLLKKFGASI